MLSPIQLLPAGYRSTCWLCARVTQLHAALVLSAALMLPVVMMLTAALMLPLLP